jgi:hypothetical protein
VYIVARGFAKEAQFFYIGASAAILRAGALAYAIYHCGRAPVRGILPRKHRFVICYVDIYAEEIIAYAVCGESSSVSRGMLGIISISKHMIQQH